MTAQTVSSAVATRDAGPVSVMWGRKTHFAAILPAHIDVKSFLGTAAAALYASTSAPGKLNLMKAAEANPDSLITALMRCAALGHQPGTEEFYLTPRMDHGRPKVLGIEGYRGIVERMYRAGAVKSVIVREVCARDQFSYTEGLDDRPVHQFGGTGTGGTGADFFGENGSRDRGPMVGVYAYAVMMTGAVSRVVILTRDDVLAARDAGGYKPDDQFSPWNRLDGGKDHPEFTGRSMWWKTAARRLEPWVPTSAEYRREQLRASAEASRALAPAPAPEAASNGHAPPEAQDIADAEIADETPAEPSANGSQEGIYHGGPKATDRQLRALHAKFGEIGLTKDERDYRLHAIATLADLPGLDSSSSLRQTEADAVLDRLRDVTSRDGLIALLAAASQDAAAEAGDDSA